MYSGVGRCVWEGKPCLPEHITWQVTDFGSCYTFNGDANNPINTEKTGSRFGLSLTVNIEQYEYMIGPNSDAGLKVYVGTWRDVVEICFG